MPSPTPMPTAPTTQKPHRPLLSISIIAICLLFVGGIVFFGLKTALPTVSDDLPAPQAAASTTFDALSLEAKAVYVYDVREDRPLFSQNGDTPLPLASITKLLTAIVAADTMDADALVTVGEQDLATEGESGLTYGEQWKLADLIAFMLITSSNDAATALRSAYEQSTGGSFIASMNAHAARLGLTDALFRNETGLDIGGAASNTGSARDAALLLAAALTDIPDALDVTRYSSFTFTSTSGTVHRVENTNDLADDIPWAVGAKTGFTDTAGGNLAISLDISIGHPVVIVVLGSSREGRFTDMQKLVEATLASVQSR